MSHLYLSPILTAVEGSTHGYDVTDPTTVSAELGGPEGLARLSAAARARGHGPDRRHRAQPRRRRRAASRTRGGGTCSSTAGIRRTRPTSTSTGTSILTAESCCRCWVPTTTSPISGRRRRAAPRRLASRSRPAPGRHRREVHDRQHYRLIGWRNGVCGYRRFFSITSLAGLRQEDRAVFDATHVEVKRWFTEGLVDGIRIDHPDGLSDPAGYLAWLRELIGPDAWIVIEKILAVDEPLEPTLPVAGTTGYDALREIGGVFVDPAGAGPLTALVESSGVALRRDAAAGPRLKAEPPPTRWPANWPGCAGRSSPPPAPTTRDLPDAVAALLSRHRRVPLRLPVAVRWCCPTAMAETAAARPELARAAGDRCRGAGEQRRVGGAAAAAVRRGHRQVDGGLPVLPRRPAGVAQRGGRRARPVRRQRRGVPPARRDSGPAVAARDDGVDHPRHQARRRRARPHRRAVAGAVAVGGARRQAGSWRRHRPIRRPDCSCGRTSSAYGRSTAR